MSRKSKMSNSNSNSNKEPAFTWDSENFALDCYQDSHRLNIEICYGDEKSNGAKLWKNLFKPFKE